MSIVSPPNKGLQCYRPRAQRQQGAALIMALMVVVMVVLLAATIGNDFLVTFRRVENQLHGKQANAYLRGAEGLARQVLQQDFKDSPEKDHRSEGWLDQTKEFPMDYGLISSTLCDLQSRFNINRLLLPRPSAGNYSPDQKFFIRLLQTLELDPVIDQQQAQDITNAVVDWLDKNNSVSSTGGAEDGYYADLDLPYRAANLPLQSTSELRWVKGINSDIYRALERHITALDASALININTADVNVVRSFNEANVLLPLSEYEALGLIQERDGDPGIDADEMKPGFSAVADIKAQYPALDLSNLAVNSEYFLLESTLLFMDREFKLYSVLKRNTNNGDIKTIARGQGGLGRCYALEREE